MNDTVTHPNMRDLAERIDRVARDLCGPRSLQGPRSFLTEQVREHPDAAGFSAETVRSLVTYLAR
jgi:hypothetical protein